MKSILIISVLLIGANLAYADRACDDLAAFVGTYKLQSKTCKGPFGDRFNVEPYTETDLSGKPLFSGYWLKSGGIGIGPATSAESTDKCETENGKVTVLTCAYERSCIPQYWVYEFSGNTVTFKANGCTATFAK